MAKININGKEIEFEQGMTVMQAAELAGEEIPRFCYHDKLKIAGNCRMCLVQIEGGPPKPAASCAMPAADGMVVHTNTPMVKKAREGVMEFQLINHPLDCPICDQAGECDLQDQAMAYGKSTSRYKEKKHAVKEKDYGPLIKTNMTRCIHCTRCVRFIQDIAGVPELGGTGRGEDMEIGTFVEKALTSELSGNIIDLCPVGALTSKPYAFKARSWELRKTESIDVLDAVGSNIRVDAKGMEVMRIVPRLNEEINEEWLSDKSRFACDGLSAQRLDTPYIRSGGKLAKASWDDALNVVKNKLKKLDGKQIAAIVGDQADCESIFALKELMESLKSPNMDCRQDGTKLDSNVRSSYLFNSTIEGIEKADFILLVGTNPREEAPVLNARIKKRSLMRAPLSIYSVGPDADLTYKVSNLGESLDILEEIQSGKHDLSNELKNASNPMIIVGSGAITRKDGADIMGILYDICKKFKIVNKEWNGFNVLHKAASRVGALDLGFTPKRGGKDVAAIEEAALKNDIKFVYLLGADEVNFDSLKKAFVVYQGHHGDKGAENADIILPAAAYTEKNATYVNLEGRPQRTKLAVFPPNEAREDWKIIKEISEELKIKTSYETLSDIREGMVKIAPSFANIDEIASAKWEEFGKKGKILKAPIEETIENFYMTCPISRSSKTMAQCSKDLLPLDKEKVA